MTRFTQRTLCACLLAAVTGCGEAPPSDAPPTDSAAPGEGLQQVSFTGIGDPATGRLQVIMGPQAAIGQVPQAAIGQIPEDSDGNAGTVGANKVQVLGTSASLVAKGKPGYPAACTGPQVMIASVELYSGFKEQLRNVYARIGTLSLGPTFCPLATGAVTPPRPYAGLYFYGPLDGGTAGAGSAIKRSVQWSLNLLDQTPFWFSGDVWAEVIPAAPVIGATSTTNNPADGSTVHTAGSRSSRQYFTWTNDPLADGQNPEGYAVARPTGGAQLTVWSCGNAGTASAPVAFNSANCRTYVVSPRLFTQNIATYNRRYTAGLWYQWSLQSYFLLPGSTTRITGSTIQTRHFAVINP